jgi:pantoate--beta-alanine ligase
MSSRNRYLDSDGRQRALALNRALEAGRLLLAKGERERRIIEETMRRELAPADSIEYAEVRSVPELGLPERLEGRTLLAVAARVEPARLIDNLVLDVTESGVTETSLLGREGEAT